MKRRTDKVEWFLDMAFRCAEQGTCLRRNFGVVLIDEGGSEVISTGYTGAPKGIPHCTFCLRNKYNVPSGERYELCLSVHAEMNALIQAGKKARGSSLYLAGFHVDTGKIIGQQPCFLCIRMIINAGVKAVCVRLNDNIREWFDPLDIYKTHLDKLKSQNEIKKNAKKPDST